LLRRNSKCWAFPLFSPDPAPRRRLNLTQLKINFLILKTRRTGAF